MASTQADVLLTKPVLMAGEEGAAASILRSRRRASSENLLPETNYSSIMREPVSQSGTAVDENGELVGPDSGLNDSGLAVSSGGELINYSEQENNDERTVSALFRQARQKAISDYQTKKLGKEALAVISTGVQQGTGKLLQQAWLNLIDSWGLTLIWINIHVFLRFVFGEQFFGKLGTEWLSSGKTGGAAKAGTGSILGIPEKGFGLLEAAVLGFLDLLVLVIAIISIAISCIFFYILTHPVETTIQLTPQILKTGFSSITGLSF